MSQQAFFLKGDKIKTLMLLLLLSLAWCYAKQVKLLQQDVLVLNGKIDALKAQTELNLTRKDSEIAFLRKNMNKLIIDAKEKNESW